MVFKILDIRKQKTVNPERQKLNELSDGPVYCLERDYRLQCLKGGTG